MRFSYDEQCLIGIFNAGSLKDTITALKEMQQFIEKDEIELCELTCSAISKLEKLTDEQYESLDLIPDIS